jgi:hypothetical protein
MPKRRTGPKPVHVCIAGCARIVSGPNRRCQTCNCARMRKQRALNQFVAESAADRKAHEPDRSWWVGRPRSTWASDVEFQLQTRFRAAGIGKDRPPIGM